jgi:threonine synthase
MRTARESGGGACAVLDKEIIEAMKLLSQTEGVFLVPACP